MWLVRESLPYLPPILRASARLVLALLFGGAALVLALRGESIPAAMARVLLSIAGGAR
ncbi:MAG TPA: hypothetical protein VFS44_07435 [Gemmatimonadaceae bacterium]|nr:hypothetical protein [Gemmatimonadaceae bacterium]